MSSRRTGPGTPLSALLARMILFCVLPLFLVTIGQAVTSVLSVRSEMDQEAAGLARGAANAVEEYLGARVSGLLSLAGTPAAGQETDWPDLYRQAQSFEQGFGSHVILADLSLRMRFNTREPFGTPLPSLPQVQGVAAAPLAIATGRPAVGDAFFGPIARTTLVAVAVPVIRDGKPTSVLLTTLAAAQFQPRLDRVALPDGWSLVLQDSKGTPIARRIAPDHHWSQDPDAGEDRGTRRYSVGLSTCGWSAVIEIPGPLYRASLFSAAGFLASAILGASLISVLGGAILSRRLGRAVAAVAGAGAGDAGAAIPVPEIVEFADLQRRLEDAAEQHRSSEAALRASEQRFRATFEQAAVGLAIVSPEGQWIRVNHKMCEIVSYTHDELLRIRFQDITHPDDLQADMAAVQRVLAGEIDSYSMEKRYIRKDGGQIWVNLTVALVWKPDGSPDYFISVVEDIEARKRMEAVLRETQSSALEAQRQARLAALNLMEDAVMARERAEASAAALRESEERFTHALSATQAAGWDRDLTTGIITHNRRWGEFLGLDDSRTDHPAELFAERIHPDDRARVAATVEEACRGDGHYTVEYRLADAEGAYRWVSDHGRVVARDNNQQALRPLRLVGAFADITGRRRAEEKLRELSLAVEQSPESIVITNLDGDIEYVNETFVQNTGYSREEVLGHNPRILKSGKTPGETFSSLWQRLSQGQTWKGEFVNRRKDGSEFIEFVIIVPLRQADGRISHYVAVKEDITEKKRLGQELDQYRHHLEELVASRTAELESARALADSANRAKSAFLANMSHEIRTPMNAIIGLTHLLRQGAPSPEQMERLDKIDQAAQHLLAIINDILDLSKIEAGRLRLEHTNFALGAMLDNVRSLISDPARVRGLSIVVDSDAVPLWLKGDPTRLRQALLNYASNAVKFSEHGTIWLRTRLLSEDREGLVVR
ncbi:MAG: PAS domain S-box protein, partial [Telmatospirillum sp.]|nr:PAS domain S-box protein [Telmatospirillum sp.]